MRMREQDQELDEQQAPFRVLSPGGRILYEPRPVLRSPPPSRAPEPYKLAPQTPGCGRSQRKSSFAIIAEPQSFAPPSSRPSSGRLSPFRGRGFKGPPPRSNFSNGPHSPPDGTGHRTLRPRPPRTGSISQQNSPKRSLIPRADPSHSGPPSKGPSPRFGRRAAQKYNSSIINSDTNLRRPAQREVKRRTELQPISSAYRNKLANKDSQKPTQTLRPGTQRIAKSEERLNKKSSTPSKNGTDGGKRFITAKTPTPRHKSSSIEALDSPSKIPLVRGSVIGNPTSTDSQAKSTTVKSSAAAAKNASNNKPANQTQTQAQSKKSEDATKPEKQDKPEASRMESSKNNPSMKEGLQSTLEDDLSLVDLLKQSSGATGTSSVVNTTTTTAVQPLQIDASSILSEGELVAKLANLEKMQKGLETNEESPASQKSSNPKKTSGSEVEMKSTQNQPTTSSTGTNNQTVKVDVVEIKVSEPNETNSKAGNLTQTMIKHFGPNSINENKSSSNNSNNNTGSDQNKMTEKMVNKAPEIEKTKEQANKRPMEDEDKQHQASATAEASSTKTDNKLSVPKFTTSKATDATNDAKKASSMANNVVHVVDNTDEKTTTSSNRAKPSSEGGLKAQAEGVSSESPGSIRSTDTGVSVNTVRGVSSAKEKTGLHLMKRSDEIETLSGNIVHIDKNGENTIPGDVAGGIEAAATQSPAVTTRWQRLKKRYCNRICCKEGEKGAENWLGKCCCSCWPKMRCLACKRDPKVQLWPKKQAKGISTMQLTADQRDKPLTRWEKLKNACRCAKVQDSKCCNWRQRRWKRQQQRQVAPSDVDKSCCPSNRRISGFCQRVFSYCSCHSKKSKRTKTVKTKHSLTSVAAPPLSEETRPKIPDVLVEHNSLMRGAIPCLPVPIAWFCLMWNVILPGSGTIFSGFFNICLGQPRFSAVASLRSRIGALIVNFIVGISQLFTVLFCLVGWGWSIWWGVTMIRLARKYKRFKDSEALANDPEARAVPEAATLPAPGVPSQGLKGK